MAKTYLIHLDENDLGQILDGLEVRAAAWEQTADYHRTCQASPVFLVEECDDADEAATIARRYRAIMANLINQREVQS